MSVFITTLGLNPVVAFQGFVLAQKKVPLNDPLEAVWLLPESDRVAQDLRSLGLKALIEGAVDPSLSPQSVHLKVHLLSSLIHAQNLGARLEEEVGRSFPASSTRITPRVSSTRMRRTSHLTRCASTSCLRPCSSGQPASPYNSNL